jgi:subtilisin family serine protease
MKLMKTCLLLAVFTCTVGTQINEQGLSENDPSPRQLKHAKDEVSKKLSSSFTHYLQETASAVTATSESPIISTLGVYKDMIPVDISASSDLQALLADLEGLEFEVKGTYGHIVSGRTPLLTLAALGRLATVNFVHPVVAVANAGTVLSEGVAALRADVVQKTYGLNGKGVKVGVLSDSYNFLGGAQSDIDSGDLPVEGVVVLEDLILQGADEGRAMLQIIHDVAPGAELFFYTAFNGLADFASGIEKLAEAGCKIIVDDIGYFAVPMFQDGPVAQAVDKVYSMGVSYFSAAGNQAQQSYASPFVDSGVVTLFGNKIHNFNPSHPNTPPDPSRRILLPITLTRGVARIVLSWDEPSFLISRGQGCQSDLDLYIYDEETNTESPIDCSANSFDCLGGTDFNIGSDAVELLIVDVQGILNKLGRPFDKRKLFSIQIVHYDGTYPSHMQVVIYGGDFVDSKTNSGTVYGHQNAKGAAAVGAAYSRATPAFGVQSIELESSSSAGGIPILFDTKGNRLPKPEIREQPRFVGPDGASTTFFGKENPGFPFPLFFGTSAAAPHVAAVAALMLQARPSLSPDEVYGILQVTAIDMNQFSGQTSMGFDFGSGYGFVNAAAAIKKTTENSKKKSQKSKKKSQKAKKKRKD